MSDTFDADTLPDDVKLKASILPSDRYRLVGLLGSGGFAEVYEAFDTVIERPVAIKIMHAPPNSADAEKTKVMLERFNREARTAAAIRHPNVVSIHDMGVMGGKRPYIVMEKLHGHDFEDELKKNGAMAPRRLMPLFIKGLDALGEGHKQGIVHKDLKPANLFLTDPTSDREDIRVVDFGIARIGGGDASLTNEGQILGTPRYIAPEYARTQSATPAVDVYQMGLILVELLTGRPVVESDNPMQCLMIHAQGDLSVSLNVLTGPLGSVVARALLHNPEDRFANAGEFKVALEAVDLDALPESYALPSPEQSIDGVSASFNQVVTNPSQRPETGQFESTGVLKPDHSGRVLIRDYVTSTGTLTVPGHIAADPKDAPNTKTVPLAQKGSGGGGTLKVVFAIGVAFLILSLLILGAVVGLKHMKESKADAPVAAIEPKEAPSEANSKAPAEDKAKAEPSKDTEPKAEPIDKAASPARPTVIEIRSEPAEAEVHQNKNFIGQTPYKVIFAPGETAPREFQLIKKGHAPQSVTITPEGDTEQTVTLKAASAQDRQKLARKAAAAKRAAKKAAAKKAAGKKKQVKKKPGNFDDLIPTHK